MQEILLTAFEWLKNLNPLIYIITIAFVPLIELRGSIPVAIAMNFSPLSAWWWSIVGSILPAFLVIPFFSWTLNYLKTKQYFPKLTAFLDKKFSSKTEVVAKQQAQVSASDKAAWKKALLKFWSIVIFVGIPLPGTGVWTGSAIASIIKMPFKKAFLAVLLGDALAGVIVLALSVGVKNFLT